MTSQLQREHPLVLVVDDDQVLRRIIRKILQHAGLAVAEASDGEEGLALFQSFLPDLIMLDVMMPGLDGFTVCKTIRDLPAGERIPIIIMTGLNDTDSINRAFELGATDFITKPINGKILPHHIRYVLRASDTLRALQVSEAKNAALLNAIPDIMLQADATGRIIDFKAAKGASPFTGFDNCTGKHLTDLLPRELAERLIIATEIALRSDDVQILEFQHSAEEITKEYEARIVASGVGRAVAILRDITEQKAYEQNRILAYYDSLTELPNRLFFRELLHRALRQADRSKKLAAVMFIDLDNFKTVNDTLGHAAGDLLLQETAERLATGVRGTDWVARQSLEQLPHMVSRIGGDEFTLLLTDLASKDDAIIVAQRLLEALSSPFIIGSATASVSASIGIAFYPADASEADLLLAYADRAMYAAKDLGKNNFQFYSPDLVRRNLP